MNRTITIGIVSAFAALTLAACGGNGGSSAPTTTAAAPPPATATTAPGAAAPAPGTSVATVTSAPGTPGSATGSGTATATTSSPATSSGAPQAGGAGNQATGPKATVTGNCQSGYDIAVVGLTPNGDVKVTAKGPNGAYPQDQLKNQGNRKATAQGTLAASWSCSGDKGTIVITFTDVKTNQHADATVNT